MNIKQVSQKYFSIVLLIIIGVIQCVPKDTRQQYIKAIRDAEVADSSEIYSNLVQITESNDYLSWRNRRVLVTTWTKHPESYQKSDTIINNWGEIWVTVVPEIKDWWRSQSFVGDTILRTEQLLGLPPNSSYSHFIDIWAKPDDLFRPAPDQEIIDQTCQLVFPTDTPEDYQKWFNENMNYSYNPPRYPWTRLGYTYDWGSNDTEIGLSEFVIQKGSTIIIDSVIPIKKYLK